MAVPKIRFPGFTEDWEQRKLGDILQYEQPQKYIVSSTNYDDSFEIPVLTAGQTFILGYTNESEGVKEASPDKPVIIFDDFTTSSHYVDFPFKIKSSAMKLLTLTNERDNIYFAFEALQNLNYVPQNHERHWISIFSDFDISIPSYGEQQKIGALFKEIDSTITLHQRKLESMKLLKKSLLQKMFPKSGETVPEVRFPGFTDAWEQRKLGDVIEIESGMDYKSLNPGDIPVYGTGGYMLSVDKALSYERDAIGIGRKGTIDKPYILKAPFWTVDTLFYCIPKENYSLNFVHCIFQKINWKKKDESTGVPSLSKTIIKNIPEYFPSLSEQKKLGKFFSSLDDTITLHQRKVEILHKLKKSLLQQMFV